MKLVLASIAAAAGLLIAIGLVFWFTQSSHVETAALEPVAKHESDATATTRENGDPTSSREVREGPLQIESKTPASDVSAQRSHAVAWIKARIVDATGSALMDGEMIVLDRAESSDPPEVGLARGKCDTNGNVAIEDSNPNTLSGQRSSRDSATWTREIAFSAPGHERVTKHVDLDEGQTVSLGDVVLRAGGTVRGRVVTQDGSPLPRQDKPPVLRRVLVTVTYPLPETEQNSLARRGFLPKPVAVSVVRTDGTFVIEGVPVGRYRITAGARLEGWFAPPSEVVDVRAGELTVCKDFILEHRTSAISGTVYTHDGQPVMQNVSHRAHGVPSGLPGGWTHGMSDADGHFTIDVPGATAYDLYVNDFGKNHGETIVRDVPAGTENLEVRLPPPSFIDLHVVGEQKEAITQFEIAWRRAGGGSSGSGSSPRPDGRARVLVRAEPFFVTISANGYESVELGPFDLNDYPAALELALKAMPTLRGRVLFQGKPVADAKVELCRTLARGSNQLVNGFPVRIERPRGRATRIVSNTDGRFSVTEREAGRWAWLVTAEGYAECESTPFDHDPLVAREEFVLELSEGGALVGRVIRPAGQSVEGTIVGISRGDGVCRTVRVGEDGHYEFSGWPQGGGTSVDANESIEASTASAPRQASTHRLPRSSYQGARSCTSISI